MRTHDAPAGYRATIAPTAEQIAAAPARTAADRARAERVAAAIATRLGFETEARTGTGALPDGSFVSFVLVRRPGKSARSTRDTLRKAGFWAAETPHQTIAIDGWAWLPSDGGWAEDAGSI
jgi:hypothetical protein